MIEINLGEFDITWSGEEHNGNLWCNLDSVANTLDTHTGSDDGRKYYSDIFRTNTDRDRPQEYKIPYIFPFAATIPVLMDVYIGVDKVFATGSDNEYRLLKDNEYFLDYIRFPGVLRDAYGNKIPADTYEVELYLRYEGQDDYVLYKTFKNILTSSQTEEFVMDTPRRGVVGYYFKIKDVTNGIKQNYTEPRANMQAFHLYVMSADVADYGNIYPFCFIDGIDKNGKTYLQQTKYNYFEFARELLAPMDLESRGYYLGRGTDGVPFNPISTIKFVNKLGVKNETKITSKDEKEKKFLGESTIHLTKGANIRSQYEYYVTHLSMIPDTQKIKGFECWNLLPYGMELESSVDEIKKSMQYLNTSEQGYNFNTYYNDVETSVVQKLKNVCDIEIIKNYNQTGRTLLHITFDIGDDTMVLNSWNVADVDFLNLTYDFSISYDSFLENSTYTNHVYADWVTNEFMLQNSVKDDGSVDFDTLDINGNGNVEEELAHSMSTIVINDIVASQQGLLKQVKTDSIDEFKTGIVESSLNSDYEYKLTVETGATLVTNLVIYDNIEQSYGENAYWQGSFLDVDTTYAEVNGYIVKVYYSEKIDASSLDKDDSWQEYTDDTDKNKVKSLAFQYLDKNGNSAILPINTMTYVIIKMHSPIDMSTNKSYNSSSVEWNAIDEYGKVIDGIIGLDSNIVSVILPYSDVMLPFTGGNGNGWIYIIITFTTIMGFALLYIGKKYKQKQK